MGRGAPAWATTVAVILVGASTAEAAAPLTLVHPAEAKIRAELGPVKDGFRTGPLSLLVRNTTDKRLHLTLRYVPDDGARSFRPTPAAGPAPALISFARRQAEVAVAAGQVAQLSLRARLTQTRDPSALEGTLLVVAVEKAGGSPLEPLVLRVQGSLATPRGVAIEPKQISMQITKWLPFSHEGIHGQRVTVAARGAEAATLLKDAGRLDGHALLHNSAGNSLDLGWSVDAGRLGLETSSVPRPGIYSGTVPLQTGVAEPQVEVTVKVRHGALWALIAVGLGSLLGGLVPLLSGLARRKDLLRAELKGVLQAYDKARGDRDTSTPVSYNFDAVLGPEKHPWESTEWMAMPKLRGAAGLFSSIHWARNDSDLDEDAAWAAAIATRVQIWLEVETAARDLGTALEFEVSDLDGHRWGTQSIHRDSLLLQDEAGEEPPGQVEADQLVRRLDRQQRWHSVAAQVWKQLADLPDVDTEDRAELIARMVKLTSPPKAELERSLAEQRELEVDLGLLRQDIEAHAKLAAVAGAEAGGDATVAGIGGVRAALNVMGTLGRRVIGLITPEVAKVGSTGSRLKSPSQIVASVEARDLWLTALLALLAAVVYVSQLYDDTWGTGTDYLKAFAAGFGAQAVIQWALLPAFQSLRNRPAAQQAGDTATTAEGGAAK